MPSTWSRRLESQGAAQLAVPKVRPAATAVRSPSERAWTGFLFFFVVEWMIMDVDHLYLSNVVSFELVCERMN